MTLRTLTVVCWCSQEFLPHSRGLETDCARLGYDFHRYEFGKSFENAIVASFNHPDMLLRAVREHDRVLFVDAECRLLELVPPSWKIPAISVRSPAQPFYITYNSGTMLVDRSCEPWLELWSRLVSAWQMRDLPEDTYIRWPGDVCDELALHAALVAHNVQPQRLELEYVERATTAPIARGLWRNEHTVLQHPTEHHWPELDDPYELKKLFVQNFAGDPNEIARGFNSPVGPGGLGGSVRPVELAGWCFEFGAHRYAPARYWESHPAPWIPDPVKLTGAQR